ncbi:hypothetical protein AAE478_009459 [Parahypoxylon ruwenzoriense]
MSLDWANHEREWIRQVGLNNTGQATQPSTFQEFGIRLLTQLMGGSIHVTDALADEVIHQILQSGKPLRDTWDDFLHLIFSAATSTSNDDSHKRLVDLLFALARYQDGQAKDKPADGGTGLDEASSLASDLTAFGWMARDYWNGPKTFLHSCKSPDAAQRAWVNLNRFMAHLSRQQRLSPVEPLREWVEDFGLWTITDGIEDPEGGREYAEAAAAWLTIACRDIYSDPAWGRRDGHESPGIPLRVGNLWTARQAEGATPQMRWDFWKARLGEIADDDAFDALIRDSARQARQTMSHAESSL